MLIAEIGNAEIGLALSTASGLLIGIFAWVGKRETAKIERLESEVAVLRAENARSVSVLERESTARVTEIEKKVIALEGHGLNDRIREVETFVAEIRGDLRSVKESTSRIERWIDRQSSQETHPHRRADDAR